MELKLLVYLQSSDSEHICMNPSVTGLTDVAVEIPFVLWKVYCCCM
jgi:hypothetical protein